MKSELIVSLMVVALMLFLLSFRRKHNEDGRRDPSPWKRAGWTRIRLTSGADNRASTSKTVVLGWTAVVAWVVIANVLMSTGDQANFATLMDGLGTSYYAVLGGPVLAAFLAKAVTDSKTSGDGATLQKTEAANPAVGDLVTTDNGGLSVSDAQYLILNACAAAFVVYAFAKHPTSGVPEFPQQLALLSGGSAATYAGTKSWSANAPTVSAMTPTKVDHASVGSISIRGANLVSPGRAIRMAKAGSHGATDVTTSAKATKVLIGGWEVPDEHVSARPDEVIITALPPKLNLTEGPFDVIVVTAAGLKDTSPTQLTVL